MSTALWLLGAALAALLALGVLVLATPARLELGVRTEPSWHVRVAVRLLGGLVPPIPLHDTRRRRAKQATRPPKTKERRRRPAKHLSKRSSRMLAAAPRLIMGLLKPIHLDRLTVDAEIGLGDPADTGQLYGLISALNSYSPVGRKVAIAVRPDFTAARVSGALDARLSAIPAAFFPPGARFAWQVFRPRR